MLSQEMNKIFEGFPSHFVNGIDRSKWDYLVKSVYGTQKKLAYILNTNNSLIYRRKILFPWETVSRNHITNWRHGRIKVPFSQYGLQQLEFFGPVIFPGVQVGQLYDAQIFNRDLSRVRLIRSCAYCRKPGHILDKDNYFNFSSLEFYHNKCNAQYIKSYRQLKAVN